MNDIKLPRTPLEAFSYAMNDIQSKIVSQSIFSTKVPVAYLDDATEEHGIGDLRIDWYTIEAQAEDCGELVTIEQWDGEYWQQYGLDAHHTVQDLFDLNWRLATVCGICGKDMTANCNNARCDE